MTIILNDKTIILPSTLSEITIGQRIRFHEQHGVYLDELFEKAQLSDNETDRQLETVSYNYERMLRVFAFFAGIDVEDLNESEFIDVIAVVYYNRLEALWEDKYPEAQQTEFDFKEEKWYLSEPVLSNGSLMSFGEFIDAKQLVKDMMDAKAGKWMIVKYLAAIYLRRKDEAYKEDFLYPTSERLKLMEELPMDIAQQVDFFLSSTTSFSTLISKSSGSQGLKEQERTLGLIMSNMDGSIFSNPLLRQKYLTSQVSERIVSIAHARLN